MPIVVSPRRFEDLVNPEVAAQRAHLALDRSLRDSQQTLFDFDDTATDDVRAELLFNRQFKSPLIRAVEPLMLGIQPWVRGLESYLNGREQVRAGRSPFVPDQHRTTARWITANLTPGGRLVDWMQRKAHDLWGQTPTDRRDELGNLLNWSQALFNAQRVVPETLIQEAVHLVTSAVDLIPGVDVDANVPRKTASPIYLETSTVLRAYLPEYREHSIVPQILAEFGVSEDDLPGWVESIDDAAVVGIGADLVLDLFNFAGFVLPEGLILKTVKSGSYQARRAVGSGVRALMEHGDDWFNLRRILPGGRPAHPRIYGLVDRFANWMQRNVSDADAWTQKWFNIPLSTDMADASKHVAAGLDNMEIELMNRHRVMLKETFPMFDKAADRLVAEHVLPSAGDFRGGLKALYHEDFLPSVKASAATVRHGLKTLVKQSQDTTFDLWQRNFRDIKDSFTNLVGEATAQHRVNGAPSLSAEALAEAPAGLADFVIDAVKGLDAPPGSADRYAEELFGTWALDHIDELTDFRETAWSQVVDNIRISKGDGVAKAVNEYRDVLTPFQESLLDITEAAPGGLPMPIRRVLAPIHSFRAYLSHFDPREALKKLSAVDPILAAELDGKRMFNFRQQMGRGLSKAAGSWDPGQERKLLPSVATQRVEAGAAGGGITTRSIAEPGAELPIGIEAAREDALIKESAAAYTDKLGRLSQELSDGLQGNAVFTESARRQFVDDLKQRYAKTLPDLVREIMGSAAVDVADDELETIFRELLYRVPGQSGVDWIQRVFRKFPEEARGILKRYDELFQGMVPVTNGAYYGLLDDHWIPKKVAGMMAEGLGGPGLKHKNLVKLMGAWKYGKVMAPGAMVRNAFTNMALIFHNLGIRGLDPVVIGQAAADLNNRTRKLPALAQRYTEIFRGSFARQELRVMGEHGDEILGLVPMPERTLQKMKDLMLWGYRGLGKVYNWEEELGKMSVFRHTFPKYMNRFGRELAGTAMDVDAILDPAKALGAAVSVETRELLDLNRHFLGRITDSQERLRAFAAKAAGEHADKVLFNYRKVPPLLNWMKGYGVSPFITFPYKAIPAMVRESLEHPHRVSLWPKMLGFMQNYDHRRDEIEAVEPEWMATGSFARIPEALGEILGTDGGDAHLNLAYLVPWGDIAEQGGLFAYRENPEKFAGKILPNIPLMNWVVELATGEDQFLGRKMWDTKTDNPRVIIEKAIARMAMNVLPSIFGFAGFGGSHSAIRLPQAMATEFESVRRFYDQPVLREIVIPGVDQASTVEAAHGAMRQTWASRVGDVLKKTVAGSLGFRARSFDLPKETAGRRRDIKRELTDSGRRVKDAVRDFQGGRISEREYLRRVDTEREFKQRYLHEHPWLVWRSQNNYYNPIDADRR